ncbi:MMS19 nucleotide excision repair protein-like protein [Hortaea werneckii]|nr:MMS19 nucleotide excision repair protein-like protein [Hortaea werneckii]
MSDIQLYLLEADKNKPEAQSIAAQSAQKLESKGLKLIDLITSLEPYINDKTDGNLRAKSVGYLADVLSAVPPKVLSGQERRLLGDFILGRIEGDTEGIGASARALLSLEGLGKWDAETAQKVLTTFVNHANPLRQFKLQTERYSVVQLVDLLLAKYREPMKKLHESDPEFMPSFIAFFEGEKDPRNLMIIFSLLQVPMTEWDIQPNAQDLFDSVFNYFPITFKPPPDDPYGITAQDLKDRLRACIAANSDFAPHAFPQLLDKLDSTSMNTKRDVLQAIQACVLGYEAKTINLYSVTLWDALKFEILNVQEEDLAVESLKALTLLGAKLAESSEGPLNAYLRPIIKECNEHLEDAPTKQSEASGRILYSVSMGGQVVADKVVKGVVPTLFNLYNSSESITKRRGLLEVFNQILRAYVDLEDLQPGINTEAVQVHAGEGLDAMVRALLNAPKAEVSFRLTSLSGLAGLVSVRKALSDTQVDSAVDAVTDIVLHERIEGHGDIRTQAMQSLTEMAHVVPHAVRDRSVPAFMVEMPDCPTEDAVPGPVLEAFAQLSTERQVFDTVTVRLKNKYNAARYQGAPASYQRALLLGLLYAFTLGAPAREDGVVLGKYYTEYAEPLVTEVSNGHRESSTLEIIGRLVNALLRPQGVHFQTNVFSKNLDWMTASSNKDNADVSLTPFTLHYYAALRPEVTDAADIVPLLQAQATLALSPASDRAYSSTVLRLLSLLVNKFANPKTMQATLEASGIEVQTLISNNPTPQATQVAFAIVKALLIQGKTGKLATQYLQVLLDLLATCEKETAHRFAILLAPDEILVKENHCLVSGLYKQKVFNQTVPSLTENVRLCGGANAPEPSSTSLGEMGTKQDEKSNYLIALSGILRWLPYSVLEPALGSLIPPLLQTLDLSTPPASSPSSHQLAEESEVKRSALVIFESVLMHDPRLLEEHVSSLVGRLLGCSSGNATQHPSTAGGKKARAGSSAAGEGAVTVRAKSLQCLALCPKQFRREKVIPFRREVVKQLLGCLDDGKRRVRAEAVRARTAWLGLDEGVDEED